MKKLTDAIIEAARKGDLPFFASYPEIALLASSKDEDNRSLLHTASTAGNLELVKLLAEAGGKYHVNDADDEVMTGLNKFSVH